MTYQGTIRNGVVELEPGASLPEGTQVEIRPAADNASHDDERPLRKYARLARKTGLPPDFAAQHDHYIHGTPKR